MEFWFSFRSSQGDFWLNSDLTFCWDRWFNFVAMQSSSDSDMYPDNTNSVWKQGYILIDLWFIFVSRLRGFRTEWVNFSIFHTQSSCFTYDKELTPCSYRNRTFNSDYAFQRMTQPPNLNSARRFDYKFQ